MDQSIGDEMAKIRQDQEIIIDSPKKKVKLVELDHDFEKQLEDFKNQGTHKQQIIIYSLLFQLLINYGQKHRKLPLDYINQLKQKVQLIETSNEQNNFQSDFYYQLLLDIQEFIELKQPTQEEYENNITNHDNLNEIEQLENETKEFADNNGKLMMQIFDSIQLMTLDELFKSECNDEDQTVCVCELLLEIADKNFYQLQIIGIVELLVQDYQIQIDQKTQLDIYICYITGNYDRAFMYLRQPGFDDIKKTPKYLNLLGDHIFNNQVCFWESLINLIKTKLCKYVCGKRYCMFNIKGVWLTYQQKFQDGILEFEKCSQINNMIADVYFFKEGICHFWIQEYATSLRMFEYGLLLQPNFKFGELLKFYALEKLGRQHEQQVLLEKLNKFNESYDIYMMNHAISVASKVKKRSNDSFKIKNIIPYDIRNLRNIILILSFYKIDCLEPQRIEQIQSRFKKNSTDQILINQQVKCNKYFNQSSNNNFQIGGISRGQTVNIQGQSFQQHQYFFCQHCGQLNKPRQHQQMD
ncbi:hypothetical protein pb186bvf_002121 [Paramecium bursaria]